MKARQREDLSDLVKVDWMDQWLVLRMVVWLGSMDKRSAAQ